MPESVKTTTGLFSSDEQRPGGWWRGRGRGGGGRWDGETVSDQYSTVETKFYEDGLPCNIGHMGLMTHSGS